MEFVGKLHFFLPGAYAFRSSKHVWFDPLNVSRPDCRAHRFDENMKTRALQDCREHCDRQPEEVQGCRVSCSFAHVKNIVPGRPSRLQACSIYALMPAADVFSLDSWLARGQ